MDFSSHQRALAYSVRVYLLFAVVSMVASGHQLPGNTRLRNDVVYSLYVERNDLVSRTVW